MGLRLIQVRGPISRLRILASVKVERQGKAGTLLFKGFGSSRLLCASISRILCQCTGQCDSSGNSLFKAQHDRSSRLLPCRACAMDVRCCVAISGPRQMSVIVA